MFKYAEIGNKLFEYLVRIDMRQLATLWLESYKGRHDVDCNILGRSNESNNGGDHCKSDGYDTDKKPLHIKYSRLWGFGVLGFWGFGGRHQSIQAYCDMGVSYRKATRDWKNAAI